MPNIRIRTKSGEVIDLEYMREAAGFEDIEPLQVIEIIDALEAALNVSAACNGFGDAIPSAWNDAIRAIRQAAGVIEEGE